MLDEKQADRELTSLVRVLKTRGLIVRRENLPRATGFRAKSGACLLCGEALMFVDRRLPPVNQVAVVVDYLVGLGVKLTENELAAMPKFVSRLLVCEREA